MRCWMIWADRCLSMPLLLLLAGTVGGETHRDPTLHYTLELPGTWRAITADEIQKLNAFVNQRGLGQTVQYVGGFRPNGAGAEGYPYILVQLESIKTAGATYDDIEKNLARSTHGTVKQVEGAFPEALKNTAIGDISLDRSRNRILLRTQSDVKGIGHVQGLTVGHIGAEGIVYLHFYALEKDFAGSLPIFEAINDSFTFDDGYGFTPRSVSTVLRAVALSALKWGVIGGITAGIMFFFRASLTSLYHKWQKPKKKRRREFQGEDS